MLLAHEMKEGCLQVHYVLMVAFYECIVTHICLPYQVQEWATLLYLIRHGWTPEVTKWKVWICLFICVIYRARSGLFSNNKHLVKHCDTLSKDVKNLRLCTATMEPF